MVREEIKQFMQRSMYMVNNQPDLIEAKQNSEASAREEMENIEALQGFDIIMNEVKKAAADLQANGLQETKIEEQKFERDLVNSIQQRVSGDCE